jgi:hypothetical protein
MKYYCLQKFSHQKFIVMIILNNGKIIIDQKNYLCLFSSKYKNMQFLHSIQ